MESSDKKQSYSQQNQQLKKLYLERQQRSKQSSLDSFISVPKQWKLQTKPQSTSYGHTNLLLNHLIYDRRKPKPKQYVALNALFNENPNQINLGFDTKKIIRSIFMTTFGFQTELLQPIADIGCNFILANDKTNDSDHTIRNYSGYKNWTVVFPEKKTKGYSVFHVKLWFIKFQKFLRVVIGTGNLHLGDWSLWANAFWWKDFKPKPQKPYNSPKEKEFLASDFQLTLADMLSTIIPKGFDRKELLFELSDYDYSGVDVVLIPSIPGTFPDDGKYGLSKIKRIMTKYSQKVSASRNTMTCNTTSLGAMNEDFFKDLYKSFMPTNEQGFRRQNVKLIYPTKSFIENQTIGAAETLFLNRSNYQKSPILRQILFRYEDNPVNNSCGSIPHLKTVVCSHEDDPNVTFYLGSHNLTKAAWGKRSQTKGGDRLTINNTELGILFLNFDKKFLSEWLPFKYPPTRYSESDQPFMRQL